MSSSSTIAAENVLLAPGQGMQIFKKILLYEYFKKEQTKSL